MEHYRDLNNDSGIKFFDISSGHIDVWFKDGKGYRYSAEKPGALHLQRMKELAEAGDGLNSYINKNVRNQYERKLMPRF